MDDQRSVIEAAAQSSDGGQQQPKTEPSESAKNERQREDNSQPQYDSFMRVIRR